MKNFIICLFFICPVFLFAQVKGEDNDGTGYEYMFIEGDSVP